MTEALSAEQVVRRFWQQMQTNDFASVQPLLAPTFVLEWPQTRERIRGGARFAQMNAEYPSQGPWRFTIDRVVASATEVVTQVRITDGTQSALAVSFFTVQDGLITAVQEYWPEPYAPPQNRRHLTEPMEPA